MTNARQNLLGGLVGLAIGAGAALLFLTMGGSYEDGIRVKNGSIELTTLSRAGFEAHGNGYRTKKKTHGCYTVVVVGGECDGNLRDLDNVKKFSFQGDNSQPHEAEDDVSGSRFTVKDGANWSLVSNNTTLRYTAATYIASISATVGGTRLSCVGTETNQLSVWLTATDCK